MKSKQTLTETVCSCCKCQLPRTDEYFCKTGRYYANGECRLSSICKKCEILRSDKTKRKVYNKKHYHKNSANLKQYAKEYRQTHRASINRYVNQRLKNDPGYRVRHHLGSRIRSALEKYKKRGYGKAAKTMDLLGCTISEFMAYMGAQFVHGMTWDNYGEWHIDHIIPCVVFDLTDPVEQKQCFHYSNLQPLWAKDNYEKGSLCNGKKYKKY